MGAKFIFRRKNPSRGGPSLWLGHLSAARWGGGITARPPSSVWGSSFKGEEEHVAFATRLLASRGNPTAFSHVFRSGGGSANALCDKNNPEVLPAKLCCPPGKPRGLFQRETSPGLPVQAAGKTQPLAGHDSRHPGTRAVAWTCPFICEKAAGSCCAPWRWPPGWLPAPCAPLGDAGLLSLLPALIPPRRAESCLAPRASHAAPARRRAHAASISSRFSTRAATARIFQGELAPASLPELLSLRCCSPASLHIRSHHNARRHNARPPQRARSPPHAHHLARLAPCRRPFFPSGRGAVSFFWGTQAGCECPRGFPCPG